MADVRSYALKHPIVVKTRDPSTGVETEQDPIKVVNHPVGIRMKGRDLRAVGHASNDTDRTLAMIAHFCKLSKAAMDEMDAEDIEALSEVVAGFRSGQETGPTS